MKNQVSYENKSYLAVTAILKQRVRTNDSDSRSIQAGTGKRDRRSTKVIKLERVI